MSKQECKILSIMDGEVGITLGADYHSFITPCEMKILFVDAAPSVDDASAAIAIEDDGSAVISGVSCAVKATPGTWKSTAMGGTNDPVTIAAGSVVSLTASDISAGTRVGVRIWFVAGTVWS